MHAVTRTVQQNIRVVSSLHEHPAQRLYVSCAGVVPILEYDVRTLSAFKRFLSGDSRRNVCEAISTTIDIANDMRLYYCNLQLANGLLALQKLYEHDISTSLVVEKLIGRLQQHNHHQQHDVDQLP